MDAIDSSFVPSFNASQARKALAGSFTIEASSGAGSAPYRGLQRRLRAKYPSSPTPTCGASSTAAWQDDDGHAIDLQDHDDDPATPPVCTKANVDFSGDKLGSYVPYVYDAVFALAHAVHSAVFAGKPPTGNTLLAELQNVSYTGGVTGTVAFGPGNGDRSGGGSYQIFNANGGEFGWIGTYRTDGAQAFVPCHAIPVGERARACHNSTVFPGMPAELKPAMTMREFNARKGVSLRVSSVDPPVGDPVGRELVTVRGTEFGGKGLLTITIDGKVCTDAMRLSPTTATCRTPAGVGGPLAVTISVDGYSSDRSTFAFSYRRPIIYSISRDWVRDGSLLLVSGAYFVRMNDYNCLYCRHASLLTDPIQCAWTTCIVPALLY